MSAMRFRSGYPGSGSQVWLVERQVLGFTGASRPGSWLERASREV